MNRYNVILLCIMTGFIIAQPIQSSQQIISSVPCIIQTPEYVHPSDSLVRWHKVINAERYVVDVATDINFKNVILIQETPDTILISDSLPRNVLIFWRVRSDVDTGFSVDSLFIQDPLIPIIDLKNGGLATYSDEFTWSHIEGLQQCRIQISSTRHFENPFIDTILTGTFLNGIVMAAAEECDTCRYYWRVSSENDFINFCPPDSFLFMHVFVGIRQDCKPGIISNTFKEPLITMHPGKLTIFFEGAFQVEFYSLSGRRAIQMQFSGGRAVIDTKTCSRYLHSGVLRITCSRGKTYTLHLLL